MLISSLIKLIKSQDKPVEYLKSGARIYRAFMSTDRYVVDTAKDRAGWKQFDTDQDAPYFGYWVNPWTLQTLSYTEGDWYLVECEHLGQYNDQIQRACEFHGPGSVATVIDDDAVTVYRQDRMRFYVPLGFA